MKPRKSSSKLYIIKYIITKFNISNPLNVHLNYIQMLLPKQYPRIHIHDSGLSTYYTTANNIGKNLTQGLRCSCI